MAKNIKKLAEQFGLNPESLTPKEIAELEAMEDTEELESEPKTLAITGAVPSPSFPARSPAKAGKAKQAIAETVTRRDAAVAEMLDAAQVEADNVTASRKAELAKKLGQQMAQSELQAIEEVAGFLAATLGSSQWLLSGVSEVLEGELIEG